jgi:hypothetical protein
VTQKSTLNRRLIGDMSTPSVSLHQSLYICYHSFFILKPIVCTFCFEKDTKLKSISINNGSSVVWLKLLVDSASVESALSINVANHSTMRAYSPVNEACLIHLFLTSISVLIKLIECKKYKWKIIFYCLDLCVLNSGCWYTYTMP